MAKVDKKKAEKTASDDSTTTDAPRTFTAPKGFTKQSNDAAGYWLDDGETAILFKPKGVRLFDGNKKIDARKPSILIIGELLAPVTLASKDDEFEGARGDVVGVFWKPGMGKEIAQALNVETWVAPLLDEDGERKTQDVGRVEPMKLYDVRFGAKLSVEHRLPILEDARKQSRGETNQFLTLLGAKVGRPVDPSAEDESKGPKTDDDDNDIPF